MSGVAHVTNGRSVFGKSPDDWSVDRIRNRLTPVVGGEWGADLDSGDDGVEIPVIRVADFLGLEVACDGLTRRRVKESKLPGRLLNPRSLLIEKSGGGELRPVGRAVHTRRINFDAICSNFIAKTDCLDNLSPAFAVYLLDAAYCSGINTPHIQQTTGIQNLRVTPYLNSKFAFPSLREQERIAAYLDASCAAIDAAVDAKRQQLETLFSLLASTIHVAVTGGLMPGAKLRPSDEPWLGDIPSHWDMRRIKDIAQLQSGEGIASEDISPTGEFPVFGGNGLRGYTSSFNHDGQFPLIGRQGALCGNINYASGKFWATEHAVVVSPRISCDKLWLGELLRVMNLNQYSNAAAQPGLAVDRIKFLRLPVPPREEQALIARHINDAIHANAQLKKNLTEQIETLVAYRNSLIHECITGQHRVPATDLKRVAAHG